MVKVIDNFFSEELYAELIEYAYTVIRSPDPLFTTNRFWLDYIIAPQPVIVYRIAQNPDLFEKVAQEIKGHGEEIAGDNLFIYYWPQYSFIPWHYDGEDRKALSVYMNPEWDRNNGGYFCYDTGSDIKTIIPRKNLAVLNNQNVEHCTTAVNSQIFRVSIQSFLKPDHE